jgi:flavin-dependent dehydrogenase
MEVNLIGFGAVGGVFAKELSKKGIKINAYEEDEKIGFPVHCSGLISKSTFEEIGIKEVLIKKFYKAYLHSSFQNFPIYSKQGMYLIDRAKLEQKLAKEAERNGTQIFLGKRMYAEEIKKLKGVIIGSDGINSETAKAFSLPPIKKFVVTYTKFFYLRKRVEDLHLFYDVSKGFFGWLIPYSNFAEVGVGSFSNPKESFQKLLNKKILVEAVKGEKRMPNHKTSAIIPMELRKKTYSNRAILIGDAAGHIKFATGGGLAFGVRIAKIASSAVFENLKDGKSLGNYEKEWKKRYLLDFKLHNLLRIALTSPFREVLFLFGRFLGTANLNPDAPWKLKSFKY